MYLLSNVYFNYYFFVDAPVILTLPHMLGASNEYRKMIRGLKPDAKKHQTFVDVQSVRYIYLFNLEKSYSYIYSIS